MPLEFLRPTRSPLRARALSISALATASLLLLGGSGIATEPRTTLFRSNGKRSGCMAGTLASNYASRLRPATGRPLTSHRNAASGSCSEGVADVSASGFVPAKTDGHALLYVSLGTARADLEVVVTGASARRAVSFRNDVAPVFSKAGCNAGACHGNSEQQGRLSPQPSWRRPRF